MKQEKNGIKHGKGKSAGKQKTRENQRNEYGVRERE